MTTPERYQRIREIFHGACDLEPDQRSAFLQSACGDDQALRAEVELLLADNAEGGTDALRAAIEAEVATIPAHLRARPLTAGSPDTAPDRIGAYRIQRLIGQGGMGVVYEAEQDRPHRRVALKLMRPGLVSEAALRRFEQEAEVLGRLRHPGIAQVYEAGLHDGIPYFAMEFVDGPSVTEYAAAKELGTRQRLRLFAQICDAVHHAHTKGVVHRDLKPKNILITGVGDPPEPQPKVLDFGIARATDADIQTTTMHTGVGEILGTIPYMSPEQVGGESEHIDTRSDVYALGVVLYELLAGRLPYDLERRVITEAARVIREDEPTRLSSIDTRLRGDIETIVGKALEKERERRYQSASELASDIRRYLDDEPIAARPPSTWYQLRKFARRNKSLVGGVAAVILVLGVGVVVSTGLYVQASRARAEAQQRAEELEQVTGFQAKQLSEIDAALMGSRLRESIVEKRRAALASAGSDPSAIQRGLGELDQSMDGVNFTDVALGSLEQNIFERALVAVEDQFADQPLVRATLLQTLAETFVAVGLLDQAQQQQNEALAIRCRILGNDHPSTLVSMRGQGNVLHARGLLRDAEACYRETLQAQRRVLGDEHRETLTTIGNLGYLLTSQGSTVEADALLQDALETSRRVFGEEDTTTLDLLNKYAGLLFEQGDFEESERHFRRSMHAHRRLVGAEHPDTLDVIHNLGLALKGAGKYAEAEPYCRESVQTRERVLGDDHPRTLDAMNNLGDLLYLSGRLSEAEALFREVLEKRRDVLGKQHPHTLDSVINMGAVLNSQGRLTEAEAFYREALQLARRAIGDEHPTTVTAMHNLGYVLIQQSRPTEAEPLMREAMERSRVAFGEGNPSTQIFMNDMSCLLRELGRLDEAESLAAETVRLARDTLPDRHWYLAAFLSQHGETLSAMERFSQAEPLMLESYAMFVDTLGVEDGRTSVVVDAVARLYDAWDKAEPGAGYDAQAAEWRAKLPTTGASPEGSTPGKSPVPGASGDH